MKRFVLDYSGVGYGDTIQDFQKCIEISRYCDELVLVIPRSPLYSLMEYNIQHRSRMRIVDTAPTDPVLQTTVDYKFVKEITERRQSFRPNGLPYLNPPPVDFYEYSPHPQVGTLSIGIAWTAKYNDMDGSRRSTHAATLVNGLASTRAFLYSLQPDRWEELQGMAVMTYPFKDFAETARFMTKLTCVVSVDTAACHLAGALGVPCFTLLQEDPSYRSKDFAAWYGSMRLCQVQRRMTFQKHNPEDPHRLAEAVAEAADLITSNRLPPRLCG